MRIGGLEPPSLSAPDPKSGAAANYAISAMHISSFIFFISNLPCLSASRSNRDAPANYAISALFIFLIFFISNLHAFRPQVLNSMNEKLPFNNDNYLSRTKGLKNRPQIYEFKQEAVGVIRKRIFSRAEIN